MLRIVVLLVVVILVGCQEAEKPAEKAKALLRQLPPGLHQKVIDIPEIGVVRYAIEIPHNYNDRSSVPFVLALHFGYQGEEPPPFTGQGMIEAFRPALSELGAVVIAPDVLGGNWSAATNEKLAVWLTERALESYAIDRKQVFVTGFSMGGAGTWHVAARHQDLFTAAIPVAARVPEDAVDWKILLYVIHSDADEVVPYDVAKQHAEELKAKGVNIEFKTINGLTHFRTGDYAPFVRDAFVWLQTLK